MNSLLEKNLAALSPANPALAERVRLAREPEDAQITPARTGAPSLRLMGLTQHSRLDPEKEAQEWALAHQAELAGRPALISGLGLGYHALALAGLHEQVRVFEPEAGLIRLAMGHLDFTGHKIEFFTQVEDLPPGGFALLEHPGSRRRLAALAERLAALSVPGLTRLLDGWGADAGPGELARRIKSRSGALDPAETYVLLINELG